MLGDCTTKEIVGQRLTALHSGDVKSLLASIQPETKYTQKSCIRRASAELLKLSISEKWVSGDMLTGRVFVPCWDAGSFSDYGTLAEIERAWQDSILFPQIEEAFRK
jgi:hypothetical protein